MREKLEAALAAADATIAWVIDHPQMSDWLKEALRTAEGRDPVAMQNDVEMLRQLIIPRIQAQIEIAMTSARID